jgi:hypothetical protein
MRVEGLCGLCVSHLISRPPATPVLWILTLVMGWPIHIPVGGGAWWAYSGCAYPQNLFGAHAQASYIFYAGGGSGIHLGFRSKSGVGRVQDIHADVHAFYTVLVFVHGHLEH